MWPGGRVGCGLKGRDVVGYVMVLKDIHFHTAGVLVVTYD